MILGYFGKTPASPDPELVKLASEKMELEPTQNNPVDMNDSDPKKGVEAAKNLLSKNDIDLTDENIFIAAACKQKGIDFLLGKVEVNGVRKHSLMPKEAKAGGDGNYAVTIDNKTYNVDIKGDNAFVDGTSYNISINETEGSESSSNTENSGEGSDIVSPMNAKVISVNVNIGDSVSEWTVNFIVEAIKM